MEVTIMKKSLIALLIAILAFVCCFGITGFAEEGEETQPVISETEPTEQIITPPTTEPTTEPTEEPIITVAPTTAPTAVPSAPNILKNPAAEVVRSGEGCIFIAKADNYTGINWYFTKNDQIVYAANAAQKFPGLKVSGDGTEIFSLESVPESLDGWNVGAVFTNAVGKQGTATCTITVTSPATPSPKPTAAPTATPKPTPTAVPTATPAPTPTAAVTPLASPDPEAEAEETEHKGFPIGLLLIAVLAAALLGGAAVLFILYRSGRLGSNGKSGRSVRKDEYDDYDDEEEDDDYRSAYRGRH